MDPAFVEGLAVDDLFPLGGEQREDYGVESDIDAEHVPCRTFSQLVQVIPESAETLGEYGDLLDRTTGQRLCQRRDRSAWPMLLLPEGIREADGKQ